MEDPTGWFYTDSALSDNIHRLIVYRRLKDFPLIVNLGLATKQIFLEVAAKQHAYYVFATIFTGLILIIMGFSVRGRLLLERKSAELRTQNLRFDAALQNMSQGLSMFDRDGRLIVCNDRYAQVYGLPAALKPGTTLKQILEHRVASGTYEGPTPEGYVAKRLAVALQRKPIDTIGELNNGRIIAVSHRPIADGSWVATHEDITSRRRSEKELERTRKFLDTVIENVPATIIVKEPREGRYVLLNRAAERFLGMSRDQLIGKTVRDILSPEDTARILAHDQQALQSRDGFLGDDHSLTTPGNGLRSVVTRKLVIRDEGGEPQYLLAVIEDVTERKRAEDQIAHMALHDALTELPNRVLFRERLEQALTPASAAANSSRCSASTSTTSRTSTTRSAIRAGDELLKAVAERLRGCVRETDTVARLGGDEFAIIQAGIEQPADALALAQRIIDAIAGALRSRRARSVVHRHQHRHRARADRWHRAGPAAAATPTWRSTAPRPTGAAPTASSSRTWTRACRRAARSKATCARRSADGEFESALPAAGRPRSDNEIAGFEALLRWRHPERGMIPPGEFIPLAEETGLIVPLGEWVLRQACAEAASWPDDVKVAVNLSPVQFRSPEPARRSSSARSRRRACRRPARARDHRGACCCRTPRTTSQPCISCASSACSIAMDDFGTGYSSLSYLQQFPVRQDQDRPSLHRRSRRTANDVALAIVHAVVGLGRSPEDHDGRRRRRDGAAAGDDQGRGLRRGAGLSFQSAETRQGDRAALPAAARAGGQRGMIRSQWSVISNQTFHALADR